MGTMATRDVAGWMKSAHFIVGCYNVEDLIQIPETKWILGSGITTLGPGMDDNVIRQNYLHIFDSENETVRYVQAGEVFVLPDTDAYPDTTTPPDWARFGPHGLALGARRGAVTTLYAINHGVREAIEVFKIDAFSEHARAAWVGTVLAPKDGFIDAVAWLPGTKGIVVTAMSDPRDPEGSARKQMKGEPVGWVREWHPDSGWKDLPGSETLSTPNGLLVSPDGRHVYVAASTNMSIVRISRGAGKPEIVSAKVAGLPDNIRWSADGKSMLAGVHTANPEEFLAKSVAAAKVGGNLDTTFNITRIDAATMKTEIVMPSGLYGVFGAATGAIEVGKRLWVSTCKSDRVAVFDLNP